MARGSISKLNGIPGELVIFVRDRTNLNCNIPDRYLTIENCRIDFKNQAGFLSSMTHEQLYTNSVLSGLRNMTFDEFTGLTLSVSGRGNGESAPLQPLAGFNDSCRRWNPWCEASFNDWIYLGVELRRSHSIN